MSAGNEDLTEIAEIEHDSVLATQSGFIANLDLNKLQLKEIEGKTVNANQIVIIGELKFIVALQLLLVARVRVLLAPVIPIPVVLLHRCLAINIISWPLETLFFTIEQNVSLTFMCATHFQFYKSVQYYRLFPPLRRHYLRGSVGYSDMTLTMQLREFYSPYEMDLG